MSVTVTDPHGSAHRLLPEKADRCAKADLRKAETQTDRVDVGRALGRLRELTGLSLKEFSAALRRDERQVQRWITGAERVQVDAIPRAWRGGWWLIAQAEVFGGELEIGIRWRKTA